MIFLIFSLQIFKMAAYDQRLAGWTHSMQKERDIYSSTTVPNSKKTKQVGENRSDPIGVKK